ncbi:MAG: hypothetical protein Q4G00_13530 [Clostridia bacterium]|nr:hypothetical protein [Clostridia bacterium]
MEERITKKLITILLLVWMIGILPQTLAEEASPAHTSDHQTREILHGTAQTVDIGNESVHAVVRIYDLYCDDCGRVIEEHIRTEENQESHAWETARVEPTCENEGVEIRICAACGMQIQETLPVLNHQFAGVSQLMRREAGVVQGSGEYAGRTVGRIASAPTCTDSGSGTLICVFCGSAEQSVEIPALGHDWGDWEDADIPAEKICVTDVTVVRRCLVCGEEERRTVSPAPGHQWEEDARVEPSCTEPGVRHQTCTVCGAGNMDAILPLGHEYADLEPFVKHTVGDVMGSGAYAGRVIGTVTIASTCEKTGSGTQLCLRCGEGSQRVVIPQGDHRWGEWEAETIPAEMVCTTDVEGVRTCLDCGKIETQVLSPAPGHKWVAVSYQEPTCTEAGEAVRQCSVCGAEETFETPAMGHSYMWVDLSTPSPDASGVREYRCMVCGDVAQSQNVAYAQMFYNNTITSFGPMMRDLIGGSAWYRVTPLDISEDGVYTYPLIASNMYTVGTATVLIDQGVQTVTYRLNSPQINVHSESLVFYPNLDALRTGENAVSIEFGNPVSLVDYFGKDERVIMAITLRADYDARGAGIQSIYEDQALMETLMELMD